MILDEFQNKHAKNQTLNSASQYWPYMTVISKCGNIHHWTHVVAEISISKTKRKCQVFPVLNIAPSQHTRQWMYYSMHADIWNFGKVTETLGCHELKWGTKGPLIKA
jgi:hypothetical protein